MKPMMATRGGDGDSRLWPHMSAGLRLLATIVALALLLALGAPPTVAAPTTYRSSCGQGNRTDDAPPSKTAHLTLSRSSGATGTLLEARGSGWPAGDSAGLRVEYAEPAQGGYSDSNGSLVIWQVGPDGSFASAEFRLPPDSCAPAPPGSKARVVVQDYTSSQVITAYAPITIVAAPQMFLVAVPGTGQVTSGDSLDATGLSWGAGTAVTLTLGQWRGTSGERPTLVEPLPNATSVQVIADSQGSFDARVPIPDQIRWGTHAQVMASATTTQLGDLAILSTAQVAIHPAQMPVMQVDHRSGDAHTRITLSGAHWWPGDTLAISACSSGPCGPENRSLVALTTVQVDATGGFRLQLAPPQNWGAGRTITFAAYATPYDPATQDIFLRTAPYTILAAPPPTPGVSWSVPVLRFDLGAVIGLAMLVAVLAILAQPLARRWQARIGSRLDTTELD